MKTEFEQLLEQSRQLAENGAVAENTKKAYSSDFQIFDQWCESLGLSSLPSNPPTIAAYISECKRRDLAASTVGRYLTAISQAHQLSGHLSPTTDKMVTATMQGYRRERGTAQRHVKPLLFEQLVRCVDQLGANIKGLRDAAILTIGWMCALRRSEISELDRSDVESVSEGLVVNVRRSKTDQEGEGRKIGIPFGNDKFCPVTVIRRWYTVAQITEGPLFFGVYRGSREKMFSTKLKPRKRINGRWIAEIIKTALEQAGYDSKGYSGHSLRAGFCTSAASSGVPEHLIMRHTGHRSERVMRGYIRDGEMFVTNPLLAVLGIAPVPRAEHETHLRQDSSPEEAENLLPVHESEYDSLEAAEGTAQSS